MPVTKRTRYEVLKRDNHTCRYCGGSAPDVKLTVDHVTPTALGGTDNPDNLVAACQDCNAGKASTSPDAVVVEDVKQDDLRWRDALQRASVALSAQRAAFEAYRAAFDADWDRYCWTRLPSDYASSIESFYKAGLPQDDLLDAAWVAINARNVDNRWRYFCGVAWRKVSQMQDVAKALLAAEEAEASD